METITGSRKSKPSPQPAAEAIELRISGADLLLTGRFMHWMPVTLIEGADDRGFAQVLFDVTSNRAPGAGAARSLLELKSKSVKANGPQSYKIEAHLKVGSSVAREAGDISAVLETPKGHTPFFAVTFDLDRKKFAGLWSVLEDRASEVLVHGGEELRPQAWLREPVLAAA